MSGIRADGLPARAAAKGPDRRRCSKCAKIKPLAQFYRPERGRPHPWCYTCLRVAMAEHRTTEGYREWLAAYLARPEVVARRRAADRKRQGRRREQRRRWGRTPLGKLLTDRSKTLGKLATATGERRRYFLTKLAAIDREVARLDNLAAGEDVA